MPGSPSAVQVSRRLLRRHELGHVAVYVHLALHERLHATTLVKVTTRCGTTRLPCSTMRYWPRLLGQAAAVDKVRADTTVVEADVGYPTDSGLFAQAVGSIARTVARIKDAGGSNSYSNPRSTPLGRARCPFGRDALDEAGPGVAQSTFLDGCA